MSEEIKAFKIDKETGYWIDPRSVYVDLHNLLCIFLAEEAYAKILNGEKDPLWALASIAEKEITRILINSAIVARIIDDQKNENSFNDESLNCGSLFEGEKKSILTLRFACNKIIHADDIGIVIVDKGTKFSFIKSKIILTGRLHSKEWNAEIDIINYIRSYLIAMDKLYPLKEYT